MCSRVYATSWLFTLNDLLMSELDTCHSKIKRGTELYFFVLTVINLIQLPNAKVKLICIVIVSMLKIDGWYINLSSMDDGGYQPHQLSQIKLRIVYHIYKVYPFRVVTVVWPRYIQDTRSARSRFTQHYGNEKKIDLHCYEFSLGACQEPARSTRVSVLPS